jgi:hypothetical protein
MGLIKHFSSSSFDTMSHPSYKPSRKRSSSIYDYPTSNPNPDPNNYKIVRAQEVGNVLVMQINYPNCTNYEGNKILVFNRGVSLIDIVNQKTIDPHFSGNANYISPIARFEPTERGWNWALSFATNL